MKTQILHNVRKATVTDLAYVVIDPILNQGMCRGSNVSKENPPICQPGYGPAMPTGDASHARINSLLGSKCTNIDEEVNSNFTL